MVRILDKHPHLTFDQARLRAHELLAQASKRVNYRTPAVLTDEQEARRSASLEALKSGRQRVSSATSATQAEGQG